MLAHDPKVKERDVQELYQILHPNAPGSSRCPMIHWNALKASAVTGDPYVPKHELVDSLPPLSPHAVVFQKMGLGTPCLKPVPVTKPNRGSRPIYATRSYRVEA